MGLRAAVARRLPMLLLAVAAAGSLWSARDLWLAHQWNQRIADGTVATVSGEMPPAAQFARAVAQEKRGDNEAALGTYKRIEGDEGNPFADDAAYNAANIYLRRALAAGGPDADPQTIPLVELAKEGYRNLLRRNPGNWDARYNLARTLKLLPEGDDGDGGGGNPPIGAERAPTTMRGFTLGLP